MARNLAVFDFDHTIIDDNSDTAVVKLLDMSKIPKEVRMLHKASGWTAYMQGIFKLLYDNRKGEKMITELIKKLPPVHGIPELIKHLSEHMDYDVIIISDSNSYFINVWLKENNLDHNVVKVFTNPAQFEGDLLRIKMYHLQDTCKLSTKNLCKGKIMQDFIQEMKDRGRLYNKVIYCGDGMNDFCPILRLSQNDLACVRENFKCVELVKKAKEGKHLDDKGIPYIVSAEVFVWNNGFDILKFLQPMPLQQPETTTLEEEQEPEEQEQYASGSSQKDAESTPKKSDISLLG